jgi:hypothetical protein
MAARPRIKKRANWPANLHEPREGYYTYRDPRSGRVHVLGRVPLSQAIFEAHEANAALEGAPRKTLAERVQAADAPMHTVADLLKEMPTEDLKPSTLASRRTQDNCITRAFGATQCSELTTTQISDLLKGVIGEGKRRSAQILRTRLIKMCKKGMALGWMEKNPAEVTDEIKAKVLRRRLTLDEFQAIRAKAAEVAPWLENAMLLALVSGQDRSTVARWERLSVKGDVAIVRRTKTEVSIAIPLDLRLDAVGLSLRDVIAKCKATGIVSKYLIHHIRKRSTTERGDPVKLDSISDAFMQARILAGIKGDDAPTFHEIRSLAKRLYVEQGDVDTKALLGHLSESSAALYANPRGIEPLKVSIKAR